MSTTVEPIDVDLSLETSTRRSQTTINVNAHVKPADEDMVEVKARGQQQGGTPNTSTRQPEPTVVVALEEASIAKIQEHVRRRSRARRISVSGPLQSLRAYLFIVFVLMLIFAFVPFYSDDNDGVPRNEIGWRTACDDNEVDVLDRYGLS